MKKFKSILCMSFMFIIGCACLFACNDPKNPPNQTNSLTKTQYATVFEAVNKSLSAETETSSLSMASSKNLMLSVSSPAYQIGTDEQVKSYSQLASNIMNYISLIMKNDNYTVTNETIAYTLNIEGLSEPVKIRQRVEYDGTNVTGMFIMSDKLENPSFHDTILFNINYDFNEEKLKSYEIKEEYFMSQSSTSYTGVKYDGENKFILHNSGESAELTAEQTSIHNACEIELAKDYVVKDYNFDSEYAQVMSYIN